MKFTTLRLYRFMSHLDSIVNFHPGINIFIGETDEGKSVIIRAIDLVLNNRPTGMQFVTYEQQHGFALLGLDNNKTIIRGRRVRENYYVLLDDAKKEFKAFGTNVPEDIAEAHSIKKVVLDENMSIAANLAKQHDPPFLLTESGGTKAKVVGKVSGGAFIVDMSIQDINKDILAKNYEKKSTLTRLDQVVSLLEDYGHLPKLNEFISEATFLLNQFKKGKEELGQLEELSKKRESLLISVSGCKNILQRLVKLPEAVRLYECTYRVAGSAGQLQELSEKRVGLSNGISTLTTRLDKLIRFNSKAASQYINLNTGTHLLAKLTHLEDRYNNLKPKVLKCTALKNKGPTINICYEDLVSVETLVNQLDKLNRLKHKQEILVTNIRGVEHGVNTCKYNVGRFTHQYNMFLDRLAICPTCNQPINKKLSGVQKSLF